MAKKKIATGKKKTTKKSEATDPGPLLADAAEKALENLEFKKIAFDLRGKVLEAEAKKNKAKEKLKEANAEYSAAIDELMKHLEPMPLFDENNNDAQTSDDFNTPNLQSL